MEYIRKTMTLLYSFLLLLSLGIYIPLYFVKRRVLRKQKLFLRERLGLKLPESSDAARSLWIHAVSVGEVHAVQGLVHSLKSRHPEWAVYLSTLTITGMAAAKSKVSAADRIFFVPFDFRCVIEPYFKRLRPDIFLLAESEFWPHLLRSARRHCSAVLLVNGRISGRSCRRYGWLKIWMRRVLKGIDRFMLQSERERACLSKIGIPSDKLEVCGNLKSDIDLPEFDEGEVFRMKKSLNIPPDWKIILAGSTHSGEELSLLRVFSRSLERNRDRILILAPRHPERAAEIERMCRSFSLPAARRSESAGSRGRKVLILDTLGELARMYVLCDLAFIGGSLVPHGGQNLLEPAFYGKPICFGPHMDNFAGLAGTFLAAGAARQVKDEEELEDIFERLEDEAFLNMGEKARTVLNSLRGATARTLEVIEGFMEKAAS